MPPSSRRVLLRGGSVYAQGMPTATAMYVDGAKIGWIGDDAGAIAYLEQADEVVDLDGQLVTPGFVDAHVHLAMTGFGLESANLTRARSLDEALELVAEFARRNPDGIVYAHGWDETTWADRRAPTSADIDRVVGGRLAYVARIDSHSAVLSSALATRVGFGMEDGWHADGRVERDAHHAARRVVDELRTPDDRRRALTAALKHAASMGVTEVHELNAPHISPWSDHALLLELADTGAYPRVIHYWGAATDTVRAERTDALAGYAGDFCVDGAIGSRTAALNQPYADADASGHLYLDPEQIAAHVVDCTNRGTQAGFHVIGDRACNAIAAGFRLAADEVGHEAIVAARHRVEHLEMPSDDVASTLGRLGVVASAQPAFDAAWGAAGELYEQRLGNSRAASMNPFRSLLDAGSILAFGSDSPVTPIDPWAGVLAAMRHHAASERLSVAEAFDAHTRGGHRAHGDDDGGVLTPGADASYAVWHTTTTLVEDGLPKLDSDALPECVRTVVGGVTVFDRSDLYTKAQLTKDSQ